LAAAGRALEQALDLVEPDGAMFGLVPSACSRRDRAGHDAQT
jgi:hypothetical protein